LLLFTSLVTDEVATALVVVQVIDEVQELAPAKIVQFGAVRVPDIKLKLAVTLFAEVIATVQVFPEVLSQPDQLEKVEFVFGVAVRVTDVLYE
jgi:hypothetical protein